MTPFEKLGVVVFLAGVLIVAGFGIYGIKNLSFGRWLNPKSPEMARKRTRYFTGVGVGFSILLVWFVVWRVIQ